MNSKVMWLLVIVALFVGAYTGYAYEKAKFVKLIEIQRLDMQRQIDDAKKMSSAVTMDASVVMMANNDVVGTYATDANGMALYTYDKDTKNVSNCTGECLTKWPPYLVSGEVPAELPENVGTIQLANGSMQYTWKGMPLYYYVSDTVKGDVTGDGVGGVWHVVK